MVFAVISRLYLIICSRLIDIIPNTILTAGCCLTYHLGLTILVKIIYHKLGVVGTSTDILTQIYSP